MTAEFPGCYGPPVRSVVDRCGRIIKRCTACTRQCRRRNIKTLTLKENQAVYEAVASVSDKEPIVLERDGSPYAVVVPYEAYQIFRAWQQHQRLTLPDSWFEQTPEEVVADIKRQGPGVPNVRPATASLAELLANAPQDPDFNLEDWKRERLAA